MAENRLNLNLRLADRNAARFLKRVAKFSDDEMVELVWDNAKLTATAGEVRRFLNV